MANSQRILVKVKGDGSALLPALNAAAGDTVEPILRVPPLAPVQGVALQQQGHTWLRVPVAEATANPWDDVHRVMAQAPVHAIAAAAPGQIVAAEPDLQQQWRYCDTNPEEDRPAQSKGERCVFEPQISDGGQAVGPAVAWNLLKDFSGLADARAGVAEKDAARVKIAHLDTGYDPDHVTLPCRLLDELQRNFVDKGFPKDARDRTPPEKSFFRNRGHGTATLALLAGNRLDGHSIGWPGYKDWIGGTPHSGIIPIRIADWVVRLTTSTMVQGFDYAITAGAHVLTMSMGGVSSHALADAVNRAYDDGVFMVTAAGNNFSHLPTPKSIVFPARYSRVLAACGVMSDGRSYSGLSFGTLQGNYGPPSKMATALGAYTPNVPWAKIDCQKIVDMDGAGTSVATPQIAAAAALWLAAHWDVVQKYPQPWMRIEAVRGALFDSADHSTAKMGPQETLEKIGRGVLRADRALSKQPVAFPQLVMHPAAEPSWSWLNGISGIGPGYSAQVLAMFNLELTQMAQQVNDVAEAIDDPDQTSQVIPASQRLRYLEAALDVGSPSTPLRKYLEEILKRRNSALASTTTGQARPKRTAVRPPEPKRRLRAYALDPSLGKRLNSLAVNETVFEVPWDDVLPWKPENGSALQSGPVGEYLEVIDVDPASNRVYPPVNLNDPLLLAQDGWPPSEGNPQFHQQMVYAVGMTTITHFERALGRRALWASRVLPDQTDPDNGFVQRLRIYPHAFRGSNAYYSPDKRALLFGYFPADSQEGDATAPGSMVFACLSSDIIAHEMTHALLDGLHRRFEQASNPDVPAFHEGFADIVALFQHFTVKDLVRFEIGRSRANLSASDLLAGLARQFGEGSSRGGPLRNFLDPATRALKYSEALEPHTRGSILVYAVYDAFLNLVSHRTGDLLRIATGGTGVLPGGALHPDLVERLTTEVCEAASDVLQMCIRALDYCPPVDITFGEYIRAVITADRDLSVIDLDGRRVAFMEAFRNRGILPRDVRTVSEETLSWSPLDLGSVGTGPNSGSSWTAWLVNLLDKKDVLQSLEWDQESNRQKSFRQNETNRHKMGQALNGLFEKEPSFYALFGLVSNLPRYDDEGQPLGITQGRQSTFEVHSTRPARRVKPNGTFQTDIVVVVNQRRPEPIDGVDMKNGWFWFRGGATFILDPREQQVRYIIVKSFSSTARLERQRKMAAGAYLSPLRALYFADNARYEPFAMMHANLSELENG